MSKNNKKIENIDNKTETEEDDDVVFEAEESQQGVATTKKLRERLKQTTAEKQENLEGWQRAKADFVNFKKELQDEKIKLVKLTKADLITQLIPVLDSFEMALDNKKEENEALREWMVGVKHIYTQFLNILKENGVKSLDCLGDKFDPEKHSSLETVSVEAEEEDTVVEVIQKGYTLEGEILRPAKVKVGKFKKDAKT